MQEPRGRVTLLVDFLADPDDASAASLTLLRWVDREARAADSDKIRTFAMHDGFRKLLRKSGYYPVKSTMEFVAKINGVDVPPAFYEDTEPVARHARRLRPGPMTAARAARPCSSASTPKATTSGTPRRARTRRSRTSTRSAGCTRSSRGTASGRPT